jgi:hypothetical protein
MRHRGHKKAVIAVAHAMLVAIYHMLTRHTTKISARTTATAGTPSAPGIGRCRLSSVKATASVSNPVA